MKSRIIVFVDHEIGYRLLEKIINNSDVELLAIVTTLENDQSWWPSVRPLCLNNNIPLYQYDESFNTNSYADVDWYFLLSWKYILPIHLLKIPKKGVINLHYSLLPELRGVYPVNQAIINNKKKTGVTYHIVNEKIDAGQIICQDKLQIRLIDTARSLQLRLDDLAFELFDKMIEIVILGKTEIQKASDSSTTSFSSRSDFLSRQELNLNKQYRALDLINLLRGNTFFQNSKNAYMIDPETGDKIYISINLTPEKHLD